MNFNQFMHPRNPYKKRKDFSSLAAEFPEFAKYVKPLAKGKVTIDFDDPDALRELTITLFKKDFDLDVHLPPDRLVPAIPQRLNYVLWIEDLISRFLSDASISGLDIGVGSSCVFPLLICRLHPKWKMIGTECDKESFDIASQNVIRNELSQRISLSNSSDWTSCLEYYVHQVDFLMCNPPFFTSRMDVDDTNDNIRNCPKTKIRLSKKTSNVSAIQEAVVDGGEVSFVLDIIRKSLDLKEKVSIFTVMLGKKSSLQTLKKELRKFQEEHEDLTFTTTEFCQGRTMRWGLGWSFKVNLNDVKDDKLSKPGKVLILNPIPRLPDYIYTLEGVTDLILTWIVHDLSIINNEVKMSKTKSEIVIYSNNDSWSNQRRKRRQNLRHQEQEVSDLSAMIDSPQGNKRSFEEDDSSDFVESFEANPSSCSENHQKKFRDQFQPFQHELTEGLTYLLHASITIKLEAGRQLSLSMKTGCQSRKPQSTHQLFQYFKNRLVKID